MREQRRRWGLWLVLIAAAIAALLYARCGAGFGLGGLGAGDVTDQGQPPQPLVTAAVADAAAPRCQIRVDGSGVTLGGAPIEIAAIADRCSGGVELTVTGDARYGDAKAVRDAVRDARIDLLDRSRR